MNMPLTVSQENGTYARLIECADQITDYRVYGKIDYELWQIIVIGICAILAGANNFVEIEQYGKERKRWLKQYFFIECPIPTHDTINRAFARMRPKDFNVCMLKWLNSLVPQSKVIHLDAKILEGYRSKDPFAILRAWADATKSVLAQIKVPYGTNEITAIPMLLDELDVRDKIITIDAIGAQKKIVQKIAEKSGDYLIALKANQHAFYNDIKLFLDSVVDRQLTDVVYTNYETIDHDHGRIEKRCCWSTEDIDWLEQKTQWNKLKSISVIETTIVKNGEKTTNRRYFISSLNGSALLILEIARSHWSIENQLHWHLDVTFGEDKSKVRGAFVAQNLSLLRAIAVSLLGLLPLKTGFSRKRQTVNRRPSLLKKMLLS